MSLIILPSGSERSVRSEARDKLQVAVDDPLTVIMIVYGPDDPLVRKVLEICTARATVKAALRKVVWVPDPTVLSAEQRAKYFKEDARAVSVGLDDKAAMFLDDDQAQTRLFVEKAFLTAEGQ